MICSRCRKDVPPQGFTQERKTCKKCRKYQKEYYEQNRDQEIKRALKSYNKQYVDDPELVRKKKREAIRKNPVSYMLWQVKTRAKKKGIPFDLSHDDIKIPECCPILGVTLEISNEHSSENSPSVDRIIPSRGYVRGNIQIISHKANSIKNNATADELQKVASYIKVLENRQAMSEQSDKSREKKWRNSVNYWVDDTAPKCDESSHSNSSGRKIMENDVLKDIIDYATQKLKTAYGFCGVAEGPKMAMLNSTDRQGNDIKIDIKLEKEGD